MAPTDGSSAHSSGSEASTITGDEVKEIILPVWGILVPPVAQDWINSGFRVSFATNPDTVKAWMVTDNGLVRVAIDDAPGADPRENRVNLNLDTIQELRRVCSVNSQAPPPGLVHDTPPHRNISSASEGATTVIPTDRRSNENDDSKDAGSGDIRNSFQHPNTPSTRRMRKVPAAFARHAAATTRPTTHVSFRRPLPTQLKTSSPTTGQPPSSTPLLVHVQPPGAPSTDTDTDTAQHQKDPIDPSSTSTLRTPRTTPHPPPSIGPPPSAEHKHHHHNNVDNHNKSIAILSLPPFPGLGPVLRAARNITRHDIEQVAMAKLPPRRPPIPRAWYNNPYALVPTEPPQSPRRTSEREAAAAEELRSRRSDLYGNGGSGWERERG